MLRFSGLLLLIVVTLCAVTTTVCADGSKLAVGDIITVVVDGEKEFTKQYQINSDGCIIMPMVAPVRVADMNTSDAAAAITKALLEVMLNPQVTTAFVERAKMQVFVVGKVKVPGLVNVGVGDRVVQALAQSGYDDTADLAHVSVRRGTEALDLDLTKYLRGEDLSVNIELQSGDTVVVPELDVAGTALILGQVTKTGTIVLKPGMTFREAMGMVGGVTVEADTEKITIKHQGTTDQVAVDYERAMAGDPNADVPLQPGDTVYVPQIETSSFTVMGGVNRPGPYPLKGKVTLTQAIGMAGGATPDRGDLGKVTLTRAPEAGKLAQTTKVDVKRIIAKGLDDPIIERGDLVYVGERKRGTNLLQILQVLMPLGWLIR